MLHFHIARVYLMPDSFNRMNYACWIITCQALIFKQVLSGGYFMVEGKAAG